MVPLPSFFMVGSLPSTGNIRARILFTYGCYLVIVLTLWAYVRINPVYLVPVLAVLAATGYFSYRMNVRLLRTHPAFDTTGVAGKDGIALTDLTPEGLVKVRGEVWKARSTVPLQKGEHVKVLSPPEGLVLSVGPDGVDEQSDTL